MLMFKKLPRRGYDGGWISMTHKKYVHAFMVKNKNTTYSNTKCDFYRDPLPEKVKRGLLLLFSQAANRKTKAVLADSVRRNSSLRRVILRKL